MPDFERRIEDLEEAEWVYDCTLGQLLELVGIGSDVHPEGWIPGSRHQLVYNLASLINGERPDNKNLDPFSTALHSPDMGDRRVFRDDPTAEAAFRIMDAFDLRQWSECVVEFRALRDALLEKYEQ